MDTRKLDIGVSTMIAAMEYKEDTEQLIVTFPSRGGKEPVKYQYSNVKPQLVALFEEEATKPNGSIGKLFVKLVKGQPDIYPYTVLCKQSE